MHGDHIFTHMGSHEGGMPFHQPSLSLSPSLHLSGNPVGDDKRFARDARHEAGCAGAARASRAAAASCLRGKARPGPAAGATTCRAAGQRAERGGVRGLRRAAGRGGMRGSDYLYIYSSHGPGRGVTSGWGYGPPLDLILHIVRLCS